MTTSIASYTSTTPPPSTGKAVLLFWADWHEDSVALKERILPALASSSSSVHFGSIEAEADPEWSQSKFGVTVVPTIVLLSNNEAVEKMEGQVEIPQITQAVMRLSSSTNVPGTESPFSSDQGEQKEKTLNNRLKTLINSNEVMLFMKGTPDAPRCGFSRQAVGLLSNENIAFGSFDILNDNEVRQGLKTYSDWPTYPQLYVRGELMGGLDIMKELKDEDGGLVTHLELTSTTATPNEPESLDDRLKKLTNRSRVMLFMKGLPSAPKCGFSRQMCELLEGYDYDAFNILQDEEVRQGLKKYSDWPTYPQLYVDGDLVGGLDICQEMKEAGDLQDLLNG